MDNYISLIQLPTPETTPSPSAMPFNNITSNSTPGFTDYFQANKEGNGFFEDIEFDNSNDKNHVGLSSRSYTSEDQSNGNAILNEKEERSGKKKKIRKPRYAFQTRSQVDILDDGYRWRKYGQKAVKNNKFPRSYYRCTHQECNVKKQVQRLTRDEGVVVTTYEGMHSHPIEKSTDNFEHILTQMQIFPSF